MTFLSQAFIVPTTRGHYNIIFHTKPFELTFRDYCGINLLLGHQSGSHYLYLNLRILQAGRLIEVKIDIKHHLGPLFGWPRPLNIGIVYSICITKILGLRYVAV